jgi:hypothetical protein
MNFAEAMLMDGEAQKNDLGETEQGLTNELNVR